MKGTYISDDNGHITIEDDRSDEIIDHIPPGVWRVVFYTTPMEVVHYLEYVTDRFKVPDIPPCESHDICQVIMDDYDKGFSEGKSLGALFYGTKGTGKTVHTRMLSNMAAARDVPTIEVSEDIPPAVLRFYISMGPCVVIFDEFGSRFSNAENDAGLSVQDRYLPMFSDTELQRVLWLFTENDIGRVDSNMIERPGRCKYRVWTDRVIASYVNALIEESTLSDHMKGYLCYIFKAHRRTVLTGDVAKVALDTMSRYSDPEEAFTALTLLNATVFDGISSKMIHIDDVSLADERFIPTCLPSGVLELVGESVTLTYTPETGRLLETRRDNNEERLVHDPTQPGCWSDPKLTIALSEKDLLAQKPITPLSSYLV